MKTVHIKKSKCIIFSLNEEFVKQFIKNKRGATVFNLLTAFIKNIPQQLIIVKTICLLTIDYSNLK